MYVQDDYKLVLTLTAAKLLNSIPTQPIIHCLPKPCALYICIKFYALQIISHRELSSHTNLKIYIYIYICMCVCVCVCSETICDMK